MNNLYQIGLLINMEVRQGNGKLLIQDPLGGSTSTWATALLASTNEGVQASMVCPAYEPFRFTDWRKTYGIRTDLPSSYIVTDAGGRRYLNCERVMDPDRLLLIADTTSLGAVGIGAKQYYQFKSTDGKVHLRHNHKANALFLGGHVESCDKDRFDALGITTLSGPDTIPGYW